MKPKKMNYFERKGLIFLVNYLINEFQSPEDHQDIESLICGTSYQGMLNLVNTNIYWNPEDEFPLIGAVGISEGGDLMMEFWSEDEEESRCYWISTADAIHKEYPVNHLKIVEGWK